MPLDGNLPVGMISPLEVIVLLTKKMLHPSLIETGYSETKRIKHPVLTVLTCASAQHRLANTVVEQRFMAAEYRNDTGMRLIQLTVRARSLGKNSV